MSWLDELNAAGEEGEEEEEDDESWDESKEKQEEEEEEEAPTLSAGHRTPLHTLARRGAATDLQAACEAGAQTGRVALPSHPERTVLYEIDEPDSAAATPLHAALIAAVQTVVDQAESDPWGEPATIEPAKLVKDDQPMPPRPAAIDASSNPAPGQLACVEVLVKAGADPSRRFFHRSALHLCGAIAGLPPLAGFAGGAAAALLASAHVSSAQLLEAIDGNGATPLH